MSSAAFRKGCTGRGQGGEGAPPLCRRRIHMNYVFVVVVMILLLMYCMEFYVYVGIYPWTYGIMFIMFS